MNQEQSRWRRTLRRVLWIVGVVVALVVAIIIVLGYVREWEWTGLVKDNAYTKRTLWDWLQLLIIPAVLAGVGLWFNRQQREQELQTADRRTQDEALQAYLDQMSAMLIPNKDQPSLYDEKAPDSLRAVARARTLTVLSSLDGDRKARVVQFLYESGLFTKERSFVDLKGADLSGATDLRGANLIGARLGGANLRGANLGSANLSGADLRMANLIGATPSLANLRGADLRGADLDGANLIGAKLSRADLRGANLFGANLLGAHLSEADLSGANLGFANLRGADLNSAAVQGAQLAQADLSKANLSEAKGWTAAQLGQVSPQGLGGTTMPDGQVLKGPESPNGPTFTEWFERRPE